MNRLNRLGELSSASRPMESSDDSLNLDPSQSGSLDLSDIHEEHRTPLYGQILDASMELQEEEEEDVPFSPIGPPRPFEVFQDEPRRRIAMRRLLPRPELPLTEAQEKIKYIQHLQGLRLASFRTNARGDSDVSTVDAVSVREAETDRFVVVFGDMVQENVEHHVPKAIVRFRKVKMELPVERRNVVDRTLFEERWIVKPDRQITIIHGPLKLDKDFIVFQIPGYFTFAVGKSSFGEWRDRIIEYRDILDGIDVTITARGQGDYIYIVRVEIGIRRRRPKEEEERRRPTRTALFSECAVCLNVAQVKCSCCGEVYCGVKCQKRGGH